MELISLLFFVAFLAFLFTWPLLLSIAYYVYSKKQKAKFFLLKSTLTGYAIYLTWYIVNSIVIIIEMNMTNKCYSTILSSKKTYNWPSGDIFAPCSIDLMVLLWFFVKYGYLLIIPILVFIHYWLVFKFFIAKKN